MISQEKKQSKVVEKYQIIPFGSIKPSGWLKVQMQKDINAYGDKLYEEIIKWLKNKIVQRTQNEA